MAPTDEEVIGNIRKYTEQAHADQQDEMEVDHDALRKMLDTRLDSTIEELQARVKEQREALDKLRASSSNVIPQQPSSDPRNRLQQLRILKASYNAVTQSKPYLPPPASTLPPILAGRTVQHTIADSKAAIAHLQKQFSSRSEELSIRQDEQRDSNLITTALEKRISRLETQSTEQRKKTPNQVARDMVSTAQARREAFHTGTQDLKQALDSFIDEHLSAMLAAEELGGPVVGDTADIDDDMLAAGFNAQGKPKPLRGNGGDAARQKRFDAIWGRIMDIDGEEGTSSERDAAGMEFKDLIEELIAALVGEGADGGTYVDLPRESAAARFLVRAKVAQFHSKDARKLKLVDFGREIDD